MPRPGLNVTKVPSDDPNLPDDCIAFWTHYAQLPREIFVPSLRSYLDNPPHALMPRVIIADTRTQQDFEVRYFGTALSEQAGIDYTGTSTAKSRAAGLDLNAGTRAWEAVTHPCGYLSKRVVFPKARRGSLPAMLEILAISFPLMRTAQDRCILSYYGEPKMLPDPLGAEAGNLGQAIYPICWIDIGAGAPNLPL